MYSDEIRTKTEKIILDASNRTVENRPFTIFVCGAKDSGKSTYLRYLINQFLNQNQNQWKLSFLDCDIGQSEFTPSGSISIIQNIDEPLFGPSASHLKRPWKSYFFGNIQVNHEQIVTYLNYVRQCMESVQHSTNEILLVNTMGWGSGDFKLFSVMSSTNASLFEFRQRFGHYERIDRSY